jgi:hypothetical protein
MGFLLSFLRFLLTSRKIVPDGLSNREYDTIVSMVLPIHPALSHLPSSSICGIYRVTTADPVYT